MNDAHFDSLIRVLTGGSLTRRAPARGLAGATFATGLARFDPDELEARKRKKKRKGKCAAAEAATVVCAD